MHALVAKVVPDGAAKTRAEIQQKGVVLRRVVIGGRSLQKKNDETGEDRDRDPIVDSLQSVPPASGAL
jgi:hypothetical protein